MLLCFIISPLISVSPSWHEVVHYIVLIINLEPQAKELECSNLPNTYNVIRWLAWGLELILYFLWQPPALVVTRLYFWHHCQLKRDGEGIICLSLVSVYWMKRRNWPNRWLSTPRLLAIGWDILTLKLDVRCISVSYIMLFFFSLNYPRMTTRTIINTLVWAKYSLMLIIHNVKAYSW